MALYGALAMLMEMLIVIRLEADGALQAAAVACLSLPRSRRSTRELRLRPGAGRQALPGILPGLPQMFLDWTSPLRHGAATNKLVCRFQNPIGL